MKKFFFGVMWGLLAMACMAFSEDAQPQTKKRVCLNMIVKNETPVICRSLASVKPFIDYWVIVDTGSTDGTQAMIKEFMKDIPGELHERPWKNFEHNRNEALALAKGKADYVLFIDADDYLRYEKNFALPSLDKDSYKVMIKHGNTTYGRVFLVKDSQNWKYVGVLHEVICCDEAKTSGIIDGVSIVFTGEGARSKDPQKYHKDALIFEEALKTDPNNSRHRFYLAQSYRDAGELELALQNYQKRAEMGGWNEEVYFALFQVAQLQERLGRDPQTIIDGYMKAYNYRPQRQEALFGLVHWYLMNNRPEEGYQLAKNDIGAPMPKDVLFIDYTVHDYRLLLDYSLCAYWTGRYQEAKLASLWLLSKQDLYQDVRKSVETNMKWITTKLTEEQSKVQKAA